MRNLIKSCVNLHLINYWIYCLCFLIWWVPTYTVLIWVHNSVLTTSYLFYKLKADYAYNQKENLFWDNFTYNRIIKV